MERDHTLHSNPVSRAPTQSKSLQLFKRLRWQCPRILSSRPIHDLDTRHGRYVQGNSNQLVFQIEYRAAVPTSNNPGVNETSPIEIAVIRNLNCDQPVYHRHAEQQ